MSVCRNYECIEWQKEPFSFLMFSIQVCVILFHFISVLRCAFFSSFSLCSAEVSRVSLAFMACHSLLNMNVSFRLLFNSTFLAVGNDCLDVMYILLLVILSLLLCITRDAINSVAHFFFFCSSHALPCHVSVCYACMWLTCVCMCCVLYVS